MLFTLEAMDARKGDALLLHFGTIAKPNLIVIDGGPSGVYRKVLKPRLEELRASRTTANRCRSACSWSATSMTTTSTASWRC